MIAGRTPRTPDAAALPGHDLAAEAPHARSVENFERALDGRWGRGPLAHDEEKTSQEQPDGAAALAWTAPARIDRRDCPEMPALSRPAVAAAPAIASVDSAPTLADTAAPSAFEVTLNDPLGVPLSLRVTPFVPGGPAPAGWTLSITTCGLNPALVRRNSERLDARLRTRSLAREVRIDTDELPR